MASALRVRTMVALASLPLMLVGIAAGEELLTRVALDQALQLALTQNRTLRAQQFALQSTKAGEITAALRPNPTMNFLAEQFGGGSAALTQYTVNIGQPIELGGKRQRRIDSARAATLVSGFQLDDVRRQTILQVKSAFAGALIARDQLALAEQNLTTIDGIERLQRLRVDKGDLSPLELLRIQVQRFTFERDFADARQLLEAAKIALRTAAGETNIAATFDVVGELGFKDIPLDRAVLMRAALDNRPDLHQMVLGRRPRLGDGNRGVKVGDLEDPIPADRLLSLDERTVRHDRPAAVPPHGSGCAAGPQLMAADKPA